MTKIAFIGGASVQWSPILVTDIALTETLAGAELVLQDINAEALQLLTQAGKRIVEQVGGHLNITSTTNRTEALRDADFVILCVAIGGLAAMRFDLEIPAQYGVIQAVGDTVGPGGLARGLRHIPFAIQVAREMEQLCPHAWLLNLTNPMTTICRAVSKVTSIRTIGLCHEISGVQAHLARLFGVPAQKINFEVARINHLPVLLHYNINGQDGPTMLQAWLEEHGTFAKIGEKDPDSLRDIFYDRLAVKLSLFQQLGILFGAGDRHVAEFFPGFLTESTEQGWRYGVRLTSIEQREALAQHRRTLIGRFVEGEARDLQKSREQLTDVMAALAGGPVGSFVVNVPNRGQIDNLPREAVVECVAQVDILGVHPLAVGALPYPAYGAIAPHVARQELIVESALTGRPEPALAALATDPLLRDPATAASMLEGLLAANARFV
jgi:alpha-galactosidase/6-phospho-beta-glucosidase family protein